MGGIVPDKMDTSITMLGERSPRSVFVIVPGRLRDERAAGVDAIGTPRPEPPALELGEPRSLGTFRVWAVLLRARAIPLGIHGRHRTGRQHRQLPATPEILMLPDSSYHDGPTCGTAAGAVAPPAGAGTGGVRRQSVNVA